MKYYNWPERTTKEIPSYYSLFPMAITLIRASKWKPSR